MPVLRTSRLLVCIMALCGGGSVFAKPDPRWQFEIGLGRGFQAADTLTESRITFRSGAVRLDGAAGKIDARIPADVYPLRIKSARVRFAGRKSIELALAGLVVTPEALDTTKPGPYRFVLERRRGTSGIRIRATVEGAPLAGARIEVFQPSARRRFEDRVAVLETSRSGVASMGDLPAGPYRVVLADAGSFARTRIARTDSHRANSQNVELGAGELVELKFRAGGAGTIVGVVEGVESVDATLILALQRRWEDGVWRPVTKKIQREGGTFSAAGLTPGLYVLLTLARGHEIGARNFEVRLGAETKVVARPGSPTARRVLLTMADKRGDEAMRFHLNRVGVLASDSAFGMLDTSKPIALDRPATPRPGDYLLLFWDLNLCRPVRVSDADEQEIRVPVPRDRTGRGAHRLAVRVELNGEAIGRLCVGLRVKGASSAFMRFGKTTTATFDDLAAGEYEVLAYDGVLGIYAGFEPNPTIVPVTISEAKTEVSVRVRRPEK